MKIDGQMGIAFHAFLTSSLCYKEGSESGAGLLNLEKQTVIHRKEALGTASWAVTENKISAPTRK